VAPRSGARREHVESTLLRRIAREIRRLRGQGVEDIAQQAIRFAARVASRMRYGKHVAPKTAQMMVLLAISNEQRERGNRDAKRVFADPDEDDADELNDDAFWERIALEALAEFDRAEQGITNSVCYRGYRAVIEFDERDRIYFAHVLDVEDRISFHGATIEEVIADFRAGTDHYLADQGTEGEGA
jgi:predicted RNase H-like HicB family nuclease